MKATRFGKNGSICDGTSGDSTQLIFLRARWYNPADGRFQSRDTWGGNYIYPITLGKWIYANSNPTTYSDPSGYFAIVKYDRQAAVNYAKQYAVQGNPAYRRFESDCTSFVSQALLAGGLIEEMD